MTAIRTVPDPVLFQPALAVESFDKELRLLVADLTSTMMEAGGVGIAAPQIGVSLRVFTYVDRGRLGHVVNPRLVLEGEEVEDVEGCLSLPTLRFDTPRFMTSIATGYTMWGEPVVLRGDGFLARIMQHETDHLDGVVFLDRLNPQAREDAWRIAREMEWYTGEPAVVKVSPHG